MPKKTTTTKQDAKEIKTPKKKRGRPKKVQSKEVKAKKTVMEVPTVKPKTKKRTYLFAVGRRKAAIARVRYHRKGEGKFIVNNKKVEEYFPTEELRQIAVSPLKNLDHKLTTDITIRVTGGGIKGQAESIRLGIARVLVALDSKYRPQLKRFGYLVRDARVKERKKYGLKRARRAPQWKKR